MGPAVAAVAAEGKEAVPPELSEAGGSAPAVGAAGGPVVESAGVSSSLADVIAAGGSVVESAGDGGSKDGSTGGCSPVSKVSSAGKVQTENIVVVMGVKDSIVAAGVSGPVPGGSVVGDAGVSGPVPGGSVIGAGQNKDAEDCPAEQRPAGCHGDDDADMDVESVCQLLEAFLRALTFVLWGRLTFS